jgi:branched-chain amino acid transport system ATP-binding protein
LSERLLTVRGLEVAYGPVVAVRGLSLHVDEGEIVALLGPNGAGKTSTLRGVTGLVRPRAGRVMFAGERIEQAGPTRGVDLGMAHVPEGRRVFPRLSVADNLMLGGWRLARRPWRQNTAGDRRRFAARQDLVFDLFPVLAQRRDQAAALLSGGEQQMLAVGRALMSEPRLLLIDELSLGLSPVVVETLLARIVELNREGLSLVLIEQFVDRALAVADRVYLLGKGRLQFTGTPAEAIRARVIESAYLAEAPA